MQKPPTTCVWPDATGVVANLPPFFHLPNFNGWLSSLFIVGLQSISSEWDVRLKAQLKTKLERLAQNPGATPGVKPMAGDWAGFYRMRHGDLRVIYMHDRNTDTIVIAHIGPRGDVYK